MQEGPFREDVTLIGLERVLHYLKDERVIKWKSGDGGICVPESQRIKDGNTVKPRLSGLSGSDL